MATAVISLLGTLAVWSKYAVPVNTLVILAEAATFYMAFSVLNYRKKLIRGTAHFWSLTVFKIFYCVLTLVIIVNSRSLATDIIDRIIGLLALSLVYAPVDVLARTRTFLKARNAAARVSAGSSS